MAAVGVASPEQAEFLTNLFDAGLLVASGVPGLYGRSADFEHIRRAFDGYLDDHRPREAESLSFPPLIPREHLERSGYLTSFPHLAGSVFAFDGSESAARQLAERASAHEDWSAQLEKTDVVLAPAACYPVYPAVAQRGSLPAGGITVDPGDAWVFRHEPSSDPCRLMMFHMRELVRLAEPDTVQAWRDDWRDRGLELLRELGLDAKLDVASDPFFGRGGKLLASHQIEQQLKFEIVVQVAGPHPTAVASFNYHQAHFAEAFGLRTADDHLAHTACLGFGHERVVLALLRTHGLDVERWPTHVTSQLWPG